MNLKFSEKMVASAFAVAMVSSTVHGATVRPVDDGRALVNPGMGWTMHYYSNVPSNYGSTTPEIREANRLKRELAMEHFRALTEGAA